MRVGASHDAARDLRHDIRDAALAATYDAIHANGIATLRDGRLAPDPLPSDGGSRWGISAVLRPRPWSSALARCADALKSSLRSGHVVYRPDAFHVTLQQFEGHRAHVAADDPRVRAYRTALSAMRSPVGIRLRGLAASPTGIVVQGWPLDDLQRVRQELHDRLAADGHAVQGPEADAAYVRTSAHASLAIFGGPVERVDELVAFVDGHRATDFGVFAFDTVWLVGYERTWLDVTLVEYGAHRLHRDVDA